MELNWRKLLNLPTGEQKLVLLADVKRITEGCADIANSEWKELKENQRIHDGRCPRCKKSDVVDKIRHVQGTGKINSELKLGFMLVKGSIIIDSTEVNYCNHCGHEWKKFKIKYISATDIVRVTLNYLGDIYVNPKKNERKDWKHDAIKVFDNCHAEAIRMLLKKHDGYMHNITKKTLNLRTLRKHYDSVFDKKISVNVKKYGS